MIPRILHYVWVGPMPIPQDHRAWIERWRRMMPDWRVMAWTDAELPLDNTYLNQAYVTRGWNRVSNYMRAWALHQHGGVYLDTDIELVRPLDPLCDAPAFLGFQHAEKRPNRVNGAVFGAQPGHALTEALLHAYGRDVQGWRRMGDNHGPGLITSVLDRMGWLPPYAPQAQRVGDLVLHPIPAFYPYPWGGHFEPACVTPETFTIHHWYGTPARHRNLRLAEMGRIALALGAPQIVAARARRRIMAARGA